AWRPGPGRGPARPRRAAVRARAWKVPPRRTGSPAAMPLRLRLLTASDARQRAVTGFAQPGRPRGLGVDAPQEPFGHAANFPGLVVQGVYQRGDGRSRSVPPSQQPFEGQGADPSVRRLQQLGEDRDGFAIVPLDERQILVRYYVAPTDAVREEM